MSRRAARPRADWDDEVYSTFLGIGTLHGIGEADDEKAKPAGVLYVPDPEQRHGWREFYVVKPTIEKPGARPIGFRRP